MAQNTACCTSSRQENSPNSQGEELMDWTKILADNGIPEPSGRPELITQLKGEPQPEPKPKRK
jgi:hypothetical protein